MENLLSFIVANFALTGSPGPNTLSLAAAGAAFGIRRSLAFMTGLTAGMLGVMAVVATGIAAAVAAVPGVMPVLLVAAMAYFAYLAYRIATAPPPAVQADYGRNPSFAAGSSSASSTRRPMQPSQPCSPVSSWSGTGSISMRRQKSR